MTLSADERATLAAVLNRLIPGDEHGPGAAEAQVLRFVEQVAAEHGAAYADGLAALEGLTALEPAEQDARLAAIEDTAFFELVRLHAIQGMFGDPSHGGNAGFAGWALLGFPGVKVTFAPADQVLDADVPPAW
jgi:Gluconate 2-dehydrogenase subunit 3